MASTILGQGPKFPFERDQQNDFAQATDAALVKSSLEQIFGLTRGELRWDKKLGSRLYKLRHVSNPVIAGQLAVVYTREAIAQEPRAVLKELRTERRTIDKRLAYVITIVYDVVSKNRASNAVIAQGESLTVEVD